MPLCLQIKKNRNDKRTRLFSRMSSTAVEACLWAEITCSFPTNSSEAHLNTDTHEATTKHPQKYFSKFYTLFKNTFSAFAHEDAVKIILINN